jgi:hypothetical protein
MIPRLHLRRHSGRLAEAVLLDPAGHQPVAVVLVGGEQGAVEAAHLAGRSLALALLALLAAQLGLDLPLDVQLGDDLDDLLLLLRSSLPAQADRDSQVAAPLLLARSLAGRRLPPEAVGAHRDVPRAAGEGGVLVAGEGQQVVEVREGVEGGQVALRQPLLLEDAGALAH